VDASPDAEARGLALELVDSTDMRSENSDEALPQLTMFSEQEMEALFPAQRALGSRLRVAPPGIEPGLS
jgi:hypothetical protein